MESLALKVGEGGVGELCGGLPLCFMVLFICFRSYLQRRQPPDKVKEVQRPPLGHAWKLPARPWVPNSQSKARSVVIHSTAP